MRPEGFPPDAAMDDLPEMTSSFRSQAGVQAGGRTPNHLIQPYAMPSAGLEPATLWSEATHSIQLSYEGAHPHYTKKLI